MRGRTRRKMRRGAAAASRTRSRTTLVRRPLLHVCHRAHTACSWACLRCPAAVRAVARRLLGHAVAMSPFLCRSPLPADASQNGENPRRHPRIGVDCWARAVSEPFMQQQIWTAAALQPAGLRVPACWPHLSEPWADTLRILRRPWAPTPHLPHSLCTTPFTGIPPAWMPCWPSHAATWPPCRCATGIVPCAACAT